MDDTFPEEREAKNITRVMLGKKEDNEKDT
jgi:hypothetical protein